MSVRKLNLTYVLGGLAVATLTLSGCSNSAPEAQRDESSGEITASAEADVFSIAVGDCLDLSSSTMATEVSSLPTVPCSDAHDSEVYAETSLEGEEYPTDLDDQAGQFCYDQFSTFVGKAYEESTLDFQYLTPTQDGWENGNDRSVQCILMSPEPVTETLEGSAL
ncbi:septum formation family protein [Cellulomonas sp. NPDC089187]|uniref:septum formation family protein n=1 Tax=Cellulomonas sp. NPDC089187 TaxID=3154970 RepID=UPI00341270A2